MKLEVRAMELSKYDLATYMIPYWSGCTVYHEAVMLLEDADGTLPDVPLLYRAEKILSVCSSDLQTVYLAGRDYILADGKLHIPEGSALPRMKHDDYYPKEPTQTSKRLNEAYGDGYIFFSESAIMHELQIAVTYTHAEAFAGPVPVCKSHLLPKTMRILQRGGELKFCIFGDSICVGGNSTAFLEAPPYAPTWWQMVADKLAQEYPASTIRLANHSLGGKRSDWGVEEAAARVGYGPDLCIIGFGMNDGSRKIPPEEFGENIRTIMAAARIGNPDCEFVLIAPILPNAQVGNFMGTQAQFLPVLQTLEDQGVAVADMTSFHQYLLTRKRYFDMSGNNVNHLNDFLARAYAQVIWQTVFGYTMG